MNISGTLHFYSGEDRELFFVFDDELAQQLYRHRAFDIDRLESRRVYISVGGDRFIHRRTLSFSRKQTEIKVSLCSRVTKDGLRSLTTLYDWFAVRGRPRPAPFGVIGTFRRVPHGGDSVWELRINEPIDLVDPPGLRRRTKARTAARRSYEHRRRIVHRNLADIGEPAEELAFAVASAAFPSPRYTCLWRKEFLDSERIEIRRIGLIADIDVWNTDRDAPKAVIEVKAQKVRRGDEAPAFYLSLAEWRSSRSAAKARVSYQIWLFRYRQLNHFRQAPHRVSLMVFETLDAAWIEPGSYLATPSSGSASHFRLRRTRNRRGSERVPA